MKRILILMADFGYGHRSAAHAIAAALQETRAQECKELYDLRVQNTLLMGYPRVAYDVADLVWGAAKGAIHGISLE